MSPTNFASTNRLSDFGLRAGHHRPTLEPEDSSTSAAICPSTKPKLFSDFGLRAILGPTLSKRDGARAVSPLPDAKEFGVLNVPEEESSLIGTHQPTDPKGRSWKWEKFPPSPRKGDEEGGTSEIGEAEHADEDGHHPDGWIFRRQAAVLQEVHDFAATYKRCGGLSSIVDDMIEELEDAASGNEAVGYSVRLVFAWRIFTDW
ncbi:hypothetical protein BGY98DRAFT_1128449 [Russula aff. rugulosa BPL654]|nr:hypothetical protein BGY98DRAFT_1128449 [Russula aff. rugulosa BPL654]